MKILILSDSINKFRLAKFKTDNLANYLEKNIKKKGIIPEKNYDFFKSKHFNQQVKTEQEMGSHPLLYKKIKETNDTVTLQIVNLTHSQKDIKINNDIVKKIKIASYGKEGKEKIQYAPAALWELELTKDEYNEMIQDEDSEAIKNGGGKSHTESIIMKLEIDFNTKPTYDYINYFKYKTIIRYEKYEKDLEQENFDEE